MEEICQLFGTMGRERSDTHSTQSTGTKLALRHRLNQLMTCVDDLDPKHELHEKMVHTLDNAFLVCGKRANKPRKDKFRWKENMSAFCASNLKISVYVFRNDILYLLLTPFSL